MQSSSFVNMDESSRSSSNGTDKSWDHSWTTKEMRTKRRDWSLAGDVGLLKHLQSFHQNVSTKADKTWEDLNSLSNQLNETAILVDNVTNISLALANTQFIESRVREEDVETIVKSSQNHSPEETKEPEISTAELIASVSENILQGLKIMDEKYDKVEVVASDSEDEGDNTVSSVILKAKDPYLDRFLPHVIGSEKWKSSGKIGLEYSSSDSEQLEEEDEEYWNDDDDKVPETSSMNDAEFENFSVKQQQINEMNNGEIRGTSQDLINDYSEPATPKSSGPLNFAEELAKRLQNVPGQKLPASKESNDSSASKLRDKSLFDSENEEDFPSRPNTLFNESKSLRNKDDDNEGADDEHDEKAETSQPSRSEIYAAKTKANFILPNIDVPPPMNNISVKPKSAIDDLFDNGDSDDSDDIFSSKSTQKMAKESTTEKNKVPNLFKNENVPKDDLFFDNSEDDDLFGTDGGKKTSSDEKSNALFEEPTKKKPVGGISMFGQVDPSALLQQRSSGFSNIEKTTKRNVTSSRTVEESSGNENDGSKHSSLKMRGEADNKKTETPTQNSFVNVIRDESEPPPLMESNDKRPKSKMVSIFDDSESEDDLFSNTNFNSKTQTSNKLPTLAQRSKVLSRKSIFDDDDGNEDDNKDYEIPPDIEPADTSENIDIFASEKQTESFSDKLFMERNTKNVHHLGKESFSNAGSQKKSLSIFNDSDEDLFGTTSESKKASSSIFDDDDENFFAEALPKGEQLKTPRITEPSTAEKKRTLEDAKNIVSRVTAQPSQLLLFDNDENEKKRPNVTEQLEEKKKAHAMEDKSNKATEEQVSKTVVGQEENKDDKNEESSKKLSSRDKETKNKASPFEHKEEKEARNKNEVDGGSFSKKSKNPSTKTTQGRDKIKNLVGKIGNLKFLSPTDTPPLWRKRKEKAADADEEGDSDTLSSPSKSVQPSPPIFKDKNSRPKQNLVSAMEKSKENSKSDNSEVAVSFDEPVKVETLSSTASKSRAKIQVKRRPQSRHARQHALRHSGIDFDVVDAPKLGDSATETNAINERLNVLGIYRTERTEHQLTIEFDKSERSISKESSMSLNKNTLLSPSTDEEDLFDVLPDLPQDSAREDPLFGEAPLLSPLEDSIGNDVMSKQDDSPEEEEAERKYPEKSVEEKKREIGVDKERAEEKSEGSEPTDPLRSISDPLENPSELFAFVTKTTSPEKDKVLSMLMQDDDDGLFSTPPSSKASDTSAPATGKHNLGLDLFGRDNAEDAGDDLFSAASISKRPKNAAKVSLFDDDDDDDASLWLSSKKEEKVEEKSSKTSTSKPKAEIKLQSNDRKKSIFEDEDDDEPFFFAKEEKVVQNKLQTKATNLEDIFNDRLSDDEDLFGKKSKKPFLFEKREWKLPAGKSEEGKLPAEKKSVNRKKIAKQVTTDDPLSLLGDE